MFKVSKTQKSFVEHLQNTFNDAQTLTECLQGALKEELFSSKLSFCLLYFLQNKNYIQMILKKAIFFFSFINALFIKSKQIMEEQIHPCHPLHLYLTANS